ncbi:hypothetical protein GCM10029978_032550 [Actinoallomurus acanthiterrae]
MKPTYRTTGAKLLLIPLLASTWGCGHTAARAEPPTVKNIPTILNRADFHGPLDSYDLSRDERIEISVGNRISDWNCIRRKGFTVPLKSIPIAEVSDDDSYGYLKFLDTPTALRYGYHLPPEAPHPETDVVRPVFGGRLGARKAWLEGCQSIINQTRSDQFKLPVDPRSGVQESIAKAQIDRRHLAVSGRWSSCMRRAGFSYRTPFDAMNAKPWGLTDPSGQSRGPVTQNEIAVARADATCRQTTNYQGWWIALLTAYENRFIRANEGKLLEARRIAHTELAAARSAAVAH